MAATVQVTDPAGYFCRTTASYPGNPIPAKPVAENSGPLTAGTPLLLTASTVAGATYSWTGPNGFTSTSQNPTIAVPTTAASGVYKVKVTVGGCVSEEATTTVVVRALPSDFNANASTDILWQNQVNGDLYIWYLNGTVTATAAYTNPKGFSSTTWQIRGLTDLNDDGKVDIFWQNISTGDLYVWFLDTAGTVTGGSYLTPSKFADTNWRASGLVDFNGDGDEDILWRNAATGQMYVWYLDNLVVSGGDYIKDSVGAIPALPGTAWEIRGLADFDGDTKPDMLWRNNTTGELYVWFLDGPTLVGASYLTPDKLTDPNWKIVRVADFNADGRGRHPLAQRGRRRPLRLVHERDGRRRARATSPRTSSPTRPGRWSRSRHGPGLEAGHGRGRRTPSPPVLRPGGCRPGPRRSGGPRRTAAAGAPPRACATGTRR